MSKFRIKSGNIGNVGDNAHVHGIQMGGDAGQLSGGNRSSLILILIVAVTFVLFAGTIAIAFVNQAVATFSFGIIFVVAMVVLAFAFPSPTAIQYLVMRIVLALASAGIAAMLTGFVTVEIPSVAGATPLIKAGGALAVFIIVYFRSPASLVAIPTEDRGTVPEAE